MNADTKDVETASRDLIELLCGSWMNALNWEEIDGREWLLVDPEALKPIMNILAPVFVMRAKQFNK